MESSINKALMVAVYMFIFIGAISLSVSMMFNILDYSEKAFEYTNKITGTSLTTNKNGIYKKYDALKGTEVVSMIINYGYKDEVKSSKYPYDFTYGVNVSVQNESGGEISLEGTKYIVQYKEGDELKEKEIKKIKYSELVNEINLKKYYYVTVNEYNNNTDQTILIKELKDDEVDSLL